MVRQRAGRTSLWMLQFLRMWRNSRRVGPRSRWTKVHEGAIPSVRTSLSRLGWNVGTAGSNPAGRHCPCGAIDSLRSGPCPAPDRAPGRFAPPAAATICGRAWNSRPSGFKNRCADRRVSVQVAPAAPDFFGEWRNSRRPSLRNSRAHVPMQVRILSRRPICHGHVEQE